MRRRDSRANEFEPGFAVLGLPFRGRAWTSGPWRGIDPDSPRAAHTLRPFGWWPGRRRQRGKATASQVPGEPSVDEPAGTEKPPRKTPVILMLTVYKTAVLVQFTRRHITLPASRTGTTSTVYKTVVLSQLN